MEDIKLKPCPFCGKDDLQVMNMGDCVGFECHYMCDEQQDKIDNLSHEWFVNCPDCGACGPLFYVGGEFGEPDDEICRAKAIECWNRRVDNG